MVLVYSHSVFSAPLDGIGFVDVRFAVFQTERAKIASNKLNKRAEPSLKKLNILEQDLRYLEQKIQKEKDSLSPKKQQELVQEMRTKGSEFQQLRLNLQNAKTSEEQKLLLSYRPILETAIKKIVTKNKIVLLLNRESIAYLAAKHNAKDVTSQLVNELNQWDKKNNQ